MNLEASIMTVRMRTIFQIGAHALELFETRGRWVVSVDGVLLRGWHSTAADAWSAGVAEVDRNDPVATAVASIGPEAVGLP